MARKRRKRTGNLTPEEIARHEENYRRAQERIAFHERMAELLGEREREQRLIAELEAKQAAEG